MTTLRDRLADLAADAPPGGPVPDLWDRGRRLQRQRRAGTAVVLSVMVVLLGVLGTTAWERSSVAPLPAGPTGQMRLPDRFYDASRWLPSTDDRGPLGPLVAVLGSETGVVGVSASSGEYRTLDLPGRSRIEAVTGSGDVEVSPDGRRVAYWLSDGTAPYGVAVYDSVTGRVSRWTRQTEFGLAPNGMAWVGDRLWFSAFDFQTSARTSAHGRVSWVWDPDTGLTTEVPLRRSPSFGNETTSAGQVVEPTGRGVAYYAPDALVRRVRFPDTFTGSPAVSPDTRRIAVVLDPTPSSFDRTRLRVAVVTPHGSTAVTRTIPGLRTNEVVAWRDDEHVVVLTYGHPGYDVVDVRTGASEPLLTLPRTNWDPGLRVAQDAWTAPTYAAPAPPTPMDPRLLWGGVVTTVVLAAGALVLWRRRVRP